MTEESKRRHVFISHHHADDVEVDGLTKLLSKTGHDIRNSSIRAKPANQRRLEQGLVRPEVIQRLLRRKISWAGTVIVLVGKDTHKRDWVDWEIKEANKQNKRIVGVYARAGTEADLPPSLDKYATAIVGWNSGCIMQAIDGTENVYKANYCYCLSKLVRFTSEIRLQQESDNCLPLCIPSQKLKIFTLSFPD